MCTDARRVKARYSAYQALLDKLDCVTGALGRLLEVADWYRLQQMSMRYILISNLSFLSSCKEVITTQDGSLNQFRVVESAQSTT
jgi:hypothetical protein